MQTVNDIRSAFLQFFAEEGHAIVPSSPLVPRNDPTLLFTNAGMVQFKNVFTGAERRDYARATTSQKCVRAGGKHNDLENVGYTARHHTFFEMLGNFSFGDYFKERAIELAWRLVTTRFGLDRDRLLVTVYAEDEDAAALWRRIAGLDDRRIIRIATSDNFWSMGETGPCGPCSEIFYDHGEAIPGGPPGSADEDGDRFIEIWNLVFMQFEQLSAAERVALPRPSIDTGMGLERVATVLQGVHNNYDIDLFRSLIAASVEATGVPATGPQAVSHRVIADHLRAAAFLIADGVLPAKDGRGYVLRRIMRRAMRHGQMLGAREPLLWKLVPALTAQMGAAYPELVRAEPLIRETLRLEETGFRETLERGLRLLSDEVGRIAGGAALPGEVAFRLYDTYGFPLDLTQDVLRGQGLTVETAGFDRAMKQQREEARRNWSGSGEAATGQVWLDLRERVGATEFLGYETETAEGVVTALVADGRDVAEIGPGTGGAVILNQTPFYGESGGQMGDTGALTTAGGARFTVTDTSRKAGDVFIHAGTMDGGVLKVGDAVVLAVDHGRRARLRANHSATHLLHEALRRRLGAHVTQKGSLVAPERLRFDFSHGQSIAAADLAAVEAEVNARIRDNSPVTTRLMTPDAAVAEGAMALFGEKYGDIVRVVSMGGAAEPESGRAAYSVELCGGTHVPQTGAIGHLRILAESAVAAGVRRVEALTGADAEMHERQQTLLLQDSAQLLKTTPAELPQRLAGLVEDRRRLERELTEMRRKLAGGSAGSEVRDVAGIRFAGRVVENVPARELKGLADSIKEQLGSGVVALAANLDGKASLVVAVTPDLVARQVSAVDLVRAGAAALGGSGGGGRPDMAQAGGPHGDAGPAAIAAIEAALAAHAAAVT